MINMLHLLSLLLFVQNTASISGIVLDTKGNPIEAVLVTIKGTDTSAYTDSTGNYFINVPEDQENVAISFSAMGYGRIELSAKKDVKQKIILSEKAYNIGQVSVWSDRYGKIRDYEAQKININSFEVYTSPTAFGDMLGVLKIIPGTQSPENDGRLYVRGGASEESQVFVDEMMVYNPYTMSQKNVSVRSRFSPQLYQGVALQSGGYGCEYGQALSGVLSLNTKNDFDSKIDVSLTSAGISGIVSRSAEKSKVYVEMTYTDMGPYRQIFKDDYEWNRHYNSLSGNYFGAFNLSKKTEIKTQFSFSKSSVDYSYTNIDSLRFNNAFSENYFWGQATLNHRINNNSRLFIGSNFIMNKFGGTDVRFQGDSVETDVLSNHNKITFECRKDKFNYMVGLEAYYSKYDQNYIYRDTYSRGLDNLLMSGFYKLEYFPIENASVSFGLRAEYSSVIDKFNIAPRLYASYRFNVNHLLSFTAGTYYQNPSNDYLKFDRELGFTRSDNVTLSYAYAIKRSKWQVDAYYKRYKNLITYKEGDFYNVNFANDGYGYARGIDVFCKGYIKMLEYWVSYSYIDSRRKYQSYTVEKMPDLISNNLLKFDLKYWYGPVKSLFGIGYHIDSGSYSEFKINGVNKLMKTPLRNSLTLNVSYLPFKNTVIHLSCQNVFGSNNIYGYTGSAITNRYMPITSISRQFFYLGVFITFSDSKNKNQLKNL